MKNKLIIAAVCVQIIGCASLKYPGWERVSIEQSVHNKPCEIQYQESCDDDDCNEWFKKRATIYGANTIVKEGDTASYFYCAAGIAPYLDPKHTVRFVRNKFYPAATQLDLDKAEAECSYESHSATEPSRAARDMDGIDPSYRRLLLKINKRSLETECLTAKGFIYTNLAEDEKSLSELNKNCPGIDNQKKYCFIPGGLK